MSHRIINVIHSYVIIKMNYYLSYVVMYWTVFSLEEVNDTQPTS